MNPRSGRKRALVVAGAMLLLGGCARATRPSQLPALMPASAPSGGTGFYHTVARGQTLYRIAKNYGVDVNELMQSNSIRDASQLEVGQRLYIPRREKPPRRVIVPSHAPADEAAIAGIVGPVRPQKRWKTITVHHSATTKGGAKNFHRDHLRRRMGGLFYHFVVGNGSYTGDGEVEAGFRWQRQTDANRPDDIQICLVGDFSRQQVSEDQFESVVALIRILQRQYSVPLSRIRGHGDIKGKHTACPGRHFPFSKLLSRLSESS